MFSASKTNGSPRSTTPSAPTSYVAELAGLERVALFTGDLALDQRLRRVGGEVAEVGRVPQRERGDGAVLDVLAHLVRRAEAGQCDLALVLRGREVARRSRDADRGGRDDALQLRVGLQQRRGLVERGLVVVVAVDGLDELDVRGGPPRAAPPSARSRRSGSSRWPMPTGSRSGRRRRSARRSGRPATFAMPSAVAWLMNRSRHSGLVSESKVTTFTPASRASLSASQIASGSFAETTRPPDALLGSGLDVAAPARSGWPRTGRPRRRCRRTPRWPPRRPPVEVSKYGLPRFFGRNVIAGWRRRRRRPRVAVRRRPEQPVSDERDAHGERRERDARGASLAIMTEHRCFLSWCTVTVTVMRGRCESGSAVGATSRLRPFFFPMAADRASCEPGQEAGRHHREHEQHSGDDVDDVGGDVRRGAARCRGCR